MGWQAATQAAQVEIEQLQLDNQKLREALMNIRDTSNLNAYAIEIAAEALASTPSQSLTEHDNEVIERCAVLADEYVCAGDDIRELKGK
jgi:hypothetical protein